VHVLTVVLQEALNGRDSEYTGVKPALIEDAFARLGYENPQLERTVFEAYFVRKGNPGQATEEETARAVSWINSINNHARLAMLDREAAAVAALHAKRASNAAGSRPKRVAAPRNAAPTVVPPREQPPRGARNGVTYVEGDSDEEVEVIDTEADEMQGSDAAASEERHVAPESAARRRRRLSDSD
jgi:hypothetical protein